MRTLLGLYPRAWRTRYGEEYAALLDDLLTATPRRRHPALILDTIRGALDARIHPGGNRMSFRTPVVAATWAAGLFIVAGLGFQKMNEDVGLAGHSAIAVAFVAFICAAVGALGALIVTALPTLAAMVRGRSAGAWLYVAVPFAGTAAWLGVLSVGKRISGGHPVGSGPNVAGAILVIGSGLAVVAATAWAASTVLRRVDAPGPAGLRSITLIVVAAGMAVTTIACIGWGVAVLDTHRSGAAGLLDTPFIASWLTVTAATAAAAAVTTAAARRQWSAVNGITPVIE